MSGTNTHTKREATKRMLTGATNHVLRALDNLDDEGFWKSQAAEAVSDLASALAGVASVTSTEAE